MHRAAERLGSLPGKTGHLHAGNSQLGSSAKLPLKLVKSAKLPRVTKVGTFTTDQTVPEGHKGLHEFLYGEQAADLHESGLEAEEPDAGADLASVADYIGRGFGEQKAGVYAIHDSHGVPKYVGFSRDVLSAVKAHLAAVGPESCSSLSTRMLPPKMLASRARLQAEAEAWLKELGPTLPAGNAADRDLWEGRKAISTLDLEKFEEQKVKLQRAMGQTATETAMSAEAEQRRQLLLRALSTDDWSSVIDQQSEETVSSADPAPKHESSSPFSARAGGWNGEKKRATTELSIATVDAALEQVRPYLLADGGNVEVVDVDSGIISLRLQGACGTCASSSMTMQNGIERVLKDTFGDSLKDVRQVDAVDTQTSMATIDLHLDMLRPAIASYGGFVQVVSFENGVCQIRYDGPHALSVGITAALRDKFPDISTVEISQ